jgi:formamidopyrimidine-DNA glycosylase
MYRNPTYQLSSVFFDKKFAINFFFSIQPTSVPPISELGPDALFEPMTLEEFTKSLHKKKTEIKALLLDQVLSAYLYHFPKIIFHLSFSLHVHY